VDDQHRCFLEDLGPILASEGIRLVRPKEVTPDQERFLDEYFQRTLMPVLTPLAIDPGHPFPHLANRSLCLIVAVRAATASVLPHTSLTVVHIPSQVVPRFVPLPGPPGQHAFVLLEDVIRLQLHALYNGYEILSCHAIRVTRDADIALERKRAVDLLTSVEAGVRERRMGDAVRLQYDPDLPAELLARLVDELELAPDDLYAGAGFTAFSDLLQLYAAVDVPRLKDQPMPPRPLPAFDGSSDVWSAIRSGDVLAHHPYHSFDAVTRFVSEAAVDPRVLAIKMTLYRLSPTSPIAQALTLAAENGKEVAVLVELQARFDEEANIRWARAGGGRPRHVRAARLQDPLQGLPRRPPGVRWNPPLLPSGHRQLQRPHRRHLRRLRSLHVPGVLRRGRHRALQHADRLHAPAPFPAPAGGAHRPARGSPRPHPPRGRARPPGPARAHHRQDEQPRRPDTDRGALPGQPGGRPDRPDRARHLLPPPGIPGLSDRIRVISIVDRYLEHARVFHFQNAGAPEYWLASADWMPRNLDHRVEIAFPVLDARLQTQIHDVLDLQLSDTVKAREILLDGSSARIRAVDVPPVRSQERLYALVVADGRA
jgi:polyphosphate kinase